MFSNREDIVIAAIRVRDPHSVLPAGIAAAKSETAPVWREAGARNVVQDLFRGTPEHRHFKKNTPRIPFISNEVNVITVRRKGGLAEVDVWACGWNDLYIA